MVSGPFDTGPVKPRGLWARFYTLQPVDGQVWDLMKHMRTSMDIVSRQYRAGSPDRTMMQQARIDPNRRGVLTAAPGSLVTPIIGREDHETLRDLVAPRLSSRIASRLRGSVTDGEREELRTARQAVLVGTMRAVADLAESRAYSNPFRPGNGSLNPISGLMGAPAGA
jgi:hypothetical protein